MSEGAGDLDEYLVHRLEDNTDEVDVYTQLANKEKDLTLAAELGKALLEKNEELERINAQLHDEYHNKLEVLEQEKHDCRFRLENAERHYDMVIKELQADINMYRQQVDSKDSHMKVEERERYQVVAELNKQNERTQEQLRKAEEVLEELSVQNESLREQLRSRHTTTQANQQQHDVMTEEISRLCEEVGVWERRVEEMTEEVQTLTSSLEERQERLHMLEKQKREKDAELESKDRQILELKDSNVVLEERLEDVYLQVSSGEFSHNNSLFSELEMSSDNLDQLGRSTESIATPTLEEPIRSLRNPLSPHVSLHELDDDDIECDDDVTDVAMVTATSSCHDFDGGILVEASPYSVDVRHEYIESYKLVRSVLRKLRASAGGAGGSQGAPPLPSPSSDEGGEPEAGLLNMLQDLRECVEEMYHKTRAQYDAEYVRQLDERIASLSVDLNSSRNQLEALRIAARDKDGQIARTGKEMDELNRRLSLQKLTLQHQEMVQIQRERDAYTDQVSKPDTAVQQARKERDQAINKRNTMEVELASLKLELASTERQLMEAIHQKIAISEQLEQCQMDFEAVLDFNIQKRYQSEVSRSPQHRELRETSPTKRLFSFLS